MKAKLKEIVDKSRQAILLANTLQFRSQKDARKMTEITLALVASERIANEVIDQIIQEDKEWQEYLKECYEDGPRD